VILSGKGGTGKTTVAAALAHLASQEASVILADADVDAANLELVLSPHLEEEGEFTGGGVAVIDQELCIACGRCRDVCRFEAIVPGSESQAGGMATRAYATGAIVPGSESYAVDEIDCEGCGACTYACPVEAIQLQDRPDGRWFRSEARYGPLFHAHLFAGRENSGKLVTLIKGKARILAVKQQTDYLLVDGPPGTGCPVIASVSGADLALLVTEPSIAGAHDLHRIVGVTQHFGVPSLVCINKWDLNPAKAEEITTWCTEQGVPVVGRIPFDQVVTRAMVQGQPVTAYSDGTVSQAIGNLWTRVRAQLGGG
jgi:MinD superfamily P-loop ATPase